MNNKRVLLIICILGIIFYIYKNNTQKNLTLKNQKKDSNTINNIHNHNGHTHPYMRKKRSNQRDAKKSPKKVMRDLKQKVKNPFNKKEIQSIELYSKNLLAFAKAGPQLHELIEDLKVKNLAPYSSIDTNKETGSLHIIRTTHSLPGTRYFHAQFFSDEKEDPVMQHMSFEVRPGDGHFSQVIRTIKEKYNLAEPKYNKERNFVSWNIQDGTYILWIKELTLKDMKNDPFNAYDKSDIGTIRVTIEQEIH